MKPILFITGGSAGIGKATAELFVQKNWRVINLSRRECPVAGVRSFQADLSKPDFLTEFAGEMRELLANAPKICLVHNAALLNKDNLHTLDESAFRNVLQINLVAPQVLNRFVLPFMKPGSSIIYIGSTLAEKAVPGAFSYVASKHAQMGMMKATCQDLHGKGIHTVGICPGFTDTEMLNTHLNHDEKILAAIKSMNGFNRLVAPGEIAEMIRVAAHQPVLNGAVIHANLGQIER